MYSKYMQMSINFAQGIYFRRALYTSRKMSLIFVAFVPRRKSLFHVKTQSITYKTTKRKIMTLTIASDISCIRSEHISRLHKNIAFVFSFPCEAIVENGVVAMQWSYNKSYLSAKFVIKRTI